jgi:Xaa-Pro aminopeptidase
LGQEDDFAARMRRVVSAAAENDLTGVIVAPGPDLVWLTGYRPTITERLTMLVLSPDNDPTLLVPFWNSRMLRLLKVRAAFH